MSKARVDAVGPATFTLINILPGFAVTTLLFREMIFNTESPAAGIMQALLALSPGILQVIGEGMLLYRTSLTAASTAGSEVPRYVSCVTVGRHQENPGRLNPSYFVLFRLIT